MRTNSKTNQYGSLEFYFNVVGIAWLWCKSSKSYGNWALIFRRLNIRNKFPLLFVVKRVYYPSPAVLFYKKAFLYNLTVVCILCENAIPLPHGFSLKARGWIIITFLHLHKKELGHFIAKFLCELLESLFLAKLLNKIAF